jgi:hypothetical protein
MKQIHCKPNVSQMRVLLLLCVLLPKATRKRWARAGLKILTTNRFQRANPFTAGGAAGGDAGAGGIGGGLAGLIAASKKASNPAVIVPELDNADDSDTASNAKKADAQTAALALLTGTSTTRVQPLKPLILASAKIVDVEDEDSLAAKRIRERGLAAGARMGKPEDDDQSGDGIVSSGGRQGGRRRSIAPSGNMYFLYNHYSTYITTGSQRVGMGAG